uniref:G protein-coupled receptor n=1 Tax=Haemonchus contortus TaxID=6289 RepID=A0A7I4Y0N1_HAECO|nr:CRE-SRAB-14 protein [Haemonchus contortus]
MHNDYEFPSHRLDLPTEQHDQRCPLGGQYGDLGWFALQSTITLLNFSAIVMNIFFMVICGRSGVMHKNMRLMLSTISLCLAVNAGAGLLYNTYFMYLGIHGFPKEAQRNPWCSVVNTLMVPWDAATCLLMVGVGAERLIATRKHLSNAVISNSVKVIFFLAIAAAVFVTFNYFMNLTDQGVCICDGASLPDRYAMLFRICVCTMVEVGTISLFGYVLILSRSEADGMGINVAKYSLSKRFQIHETYRTTQMLLPSAVLHAVLYLSYLCLLIPVRNMRADQSLTLHQFNLSTIIFAFPSIYGLAHPLICLSRHFYLRQRVDDLLASFFGRNPSITLELAPDNGENATMHITPELSSSHSFRSEHDRRVDFHVAPDRHAEILATFWDRQEDHRGTL